MFRFFLGEVVTKLILNLVAWAACSMLSSVVIASPEQYQLDLSVSRDGVVVSQPSFTVNDGQIADLTVQDPESALPELRLSAKASTSPASKNDKRVIQVDLQVFERVAGEWVLRGEPSIGTYMDQKATLALGSNGLQRPAANYSVDVTVSKADVDAQRRAIMGAAQSSAAMPAI